MGALARAGVSALAAWDLATGTIPADLVEACTRHRVPLFKVPEDVSFATVTEEVVRHLSGARAATSPPSWTGTAYRRGHRSRRRPGPGRPLPRPHPDRPRRRGSGAARPVTSPAPSSRHRSCRTTCPASTCPSSPSPRTRPASPTGSSPSKATSPTGPPNAAPSPPNSPRSSPSSGPVWTRRAPPTFSPLTRPARPARRRPRRRRRRLRPRPLRPADLRAVLTEILPSPVIALLDDEVLAVVPSGHDVAAGIQDALDFLAPGLAGAAWRSASATRPPTDLRGALEEARYACRLAATRPSPPASYATTSWPPTSSSWRASRTTSARSSGCASWIRCTTTTGPTAPTSSAPWRRSAVFGLLGTVRRAAASAR